MTRNKVGKAFCPKSIGVETVAIHLNTACVRCGCERFIPVDYSELKPPPGAKLDLALQRKIAYGSIRALMGETNPPCWSCPECGLRLHTPGFMFEDNAEMDAMRLRAIEEAYASYVPLTTQGRRELSGSGSLISVIANVPNDITTFRIAEAVSDETEETVYPRNRDALWCIAWFLNSEQVKKDGGIIEFRGARWKVVNLGDQSAPKIHATRQ